MSDSYSQNGQDRFVIDTIFPGKESGVFLDVGAYDGVLHSNTYLLERDYGWTGILVEAEPSIYERCKAARSATAINVAISEDGEELSFVSHRGLSGLAKSMHPRQLGAIEKDAEAAGESVRYINVAAKPLDQILAITDLTEVDYVSVDVEGAEYDVFTGLFRSGIPVKSISVENNYADYKTSKLIQANGFTLVERLGRDDIYVHKSALTKRLNARAAAMRRNAPLRAFKDLARKLMRG